MGIISYISLFLQQFIQKQNHELFFFFLTLIISSVPRSLTLLIARSCDTWRTWCHSALRRVVLLRSRLAHGHALRIHGHHGIGLALLRRQLVVAHLLLSPRRSRSHVRLAGRRDDCTVRNHSLHDTRRHLLRILADLGAIVAVTVNASPNEQCKM
jgi:hypothetical protein